MTETAPEIDCVVFDRRDQSARRVAVEELPKLLASPERFAWVDVHGPDIGVTRRIAADLGLQMSPKDHFGTPEILPRLLEAPDHCGFYLYEVLHPERHLEISHGLSPIEIVRLFVVIGGNVILTHHRRTVEAVEHVQATCADAFRIAGRTPSFVAFLLLQESLYDIAHLNLANDNYLDAIQEQVLAPGETQVPPDVAVAGTNILTLKKLATSLHIVLMRLATKRSPFVSDAARESFLVMMENALAVREAVDSSRSLLDGILAAVQAEAANRTSEIARVLTVISGVLLPITVVAGIYGMNFENMPELHTRWGYFAALTVMAGIAAGQIVLFRRLGWIGHPRSLR